MLVYYVEKMGTNLEVLKWIHKLHNTKDVDKFFKKLSMKLSN